MASAMETFDRKEKVFLILSAVFLASMTMLNVVGLTKFIQLGPLQLAVGVLPYPLTFLCTDLVSELYGKERANFLVWTGLALNVLVIGVVYLGEHITSVPSSSQPPWQTLQLSAPVNLATGAVAEGTTELFSLIYSCTMGSVLASMVAYMAAQFCDVYLFHFWKRVTKGKHLWVRNNFSTMMSQLVDSVAVIGVTFGSMVMSGAMSLETAMTLLGANYLFKVIAAAVDTIPLYFLVHHLNSYLGLKDKP